jgi:hypothetical protein
MPDAESDLGMAGRKLPPNPRLQSDRLRRARSAGFYGYLVQRAFGGG